MTLHSNIKELFIGSNDIFNEISDIYENFSAIVLHGLPGVGETKILKEMMNYLSNHKNEALYVNVGNSTLEATDKLDSDVFRSVFLNDALIDYFRDTTRFNQFVDRLVTFTPPDCHLTIFINNFDIACNHSKKLVSECLKNISEYPNNHVNFIILSRYPYSISKPVFYSKLILSTLKIRTLNNSGDVLMFIFGITAGLIIAILFYIYLNA